MLTPKECIARLVALGMSRAEIARRVGVHRASVSHYMRGVGTTYVVADKLRHLVAEREEEVKKILRLSDDSEAEE